MRGPARAILCLLLLTSLALAGCSGGDDSTTSSGSPVTSFGPTSGRTTTGSGGGGGGTTSGSTGGGGGGGGGGTGTGAENHAPTGSISASIQEGPIPVTVNFTLQGADQDGDAIQWNLDMDGDGNTDKSGTTLPASEAYNYTSAGSFNVTFAISDGTDSNVYTITINATAAAGGGGPQEVFSGSWDAGAYGCALRRTAYDPAGDGVNYQTALTQPAWAGKTYSVEFTSTAPSFFTAQVNDADGVAVQSHSTRSVPPPSGAPGTTATFQETMPAEANWMFFSSCGGGASVTVTVG